jgi:hypothetical protein
MLVTVGIAKLADDRIRIEVQRPQSVARAERIYSDVQDVRRVLANFEIANDAIDYFLKLLPDIEENQTLTFPPLDIPSHQLSQEELGIETQ